jgi:leucyl aminopeptidase (aminopeptidase T)
MKTTGVRLENLKLILDKMVRIRPGSNLLVVADDYVRPMSLAYDIVDVANTMGADAVLAIFRSRTFIAEEPPRTVAAAMKVADVAMEVTETSEIGHSTARKEATEAGLKRIVFLSGDDGEDRLQKPILWEDLKIIKERTDRLAEIETKGKQVRLTTPYGTNLTFSIEGRVAFPLSPLSDAPLFVVPDYAEAAVSVVEGSTEGTVVFDSFIQGWKYILPEPISFEVKKGRVQIETITSDIPEQVERFKKLVSMDDMAGNCAAELGIGTSHTIPGYPRGYMIDKGRLGHVHIACGRNYDIGGESASVIHQDGDMRRATIVIDGVTVMENGELKV